MLRGRRQGLPLPDQGSLLLEVGASLALPSAAIIGLPVLRGPCLWSTFFLALFFLERFLHHRTGTQQRYGIIWDEQLVWKLAFALASLVLTAQSLHQVIYILHDGAYPTTDVGTSLLRALGLVSLDSSGYICVYAPLLLVLLVSATQLFWKRQQSALLQGFQRVDLESVPAGGAQVFRRAVLACSLLAAPTALAQPALCSLPYFAATVGLIWWCALLQGTKSTEGVTSDSDWFRQDPTDTPSEGGGARISRPLLRGCLAYTAAHIVALYIWQLEGVRYGWLKPVAEILGLYVADPAHGGGGWTNLPYLIQSVGLLGMFSCLCATGALHSSHNADQSPLMQPLVEDPDPSVRARRRIVITTPGPATRFMCRYGSFVVALMLGTWALLDPCILSIPPLAFALYLLISPCKHAQLPVALHAPLFYTMAWAVVQYLYAAAPGTYDQAQSWNPSLDLLAALGVDLRRNKGSVRTAIPALAVVFQMAPVLVTACMARLARLTPSSREMSAAAAVAAIERHTRAAALGLSAGEGARITWADDGVEDDDELGDAFWDGDAAWINYIAHPTNHDVLGNKFFRTAMQAVVVLLVPVALYCQGLTQDNLIHSVFIVLFLGTVMQPARLALIRMVLLYSSAALLVLYTWSLSRYPSLARLNNEERRGMLQLLGLWDVSIEQDCAPVYALALLSAGCLYTFKALLHIPSDMHSVSEAHTLVEALGTRGPSRHGTPGTLRQCVGVVVDGCGAYMVLLSVMVLVYCSDRTILTLGYVVLGVICIVVPLPSSPKSERSVRRWRILLNYAMASYLAMYLFGTFDLAGGVFGFSSQTQRFLKEDLGLPLKETPLRLMADLAQPTVVLVLLQLYRSGLGSRYWIVSPNSVPSFSPNMYSLGDAADDFIQRWSEWQELVPHRAVVWYLRRFAVLHSGKLVMAAACYASLQTPDVVGLAYQLAIVMSCLTPKTDCRSFKIMKVLSAFSICAQFAYQIECLRGKGGGGGTTLLSWVGVRVVGRGAASMERCVRGKVMVLVAAELRRCSLAWLQQVPRALRVGALPEPCFLFWPAHLRAAPPTSSNAAAAAVPSQPDPSTIKTKSFCSQLRDLVQWSKLRHQLLRVRSQAQHYLEHMYAICMPLPAVMVTATAALWVLNIVSLIYLAIVAAIVLVPHVFRSGPVNALQETQRRRAYLLLSALTGTILILQYTAFLGLPSTDRADLPQMTPPSPYADSSIPLSMEWPSLPPSMPTPLAPAKFPPSNLTTAPLAGATPAATGSPNSLDPISSVPGLGRRLVATSAAEREAGCCGRQEDDAQRERQRRRHSLKTWLGLEVQDPWVLVAYSAVFFVFSCQARAILIMDEASEDPRAGLGMDPYAKYQAANGPVVWAELVFSKIKDWTILDWIRFGTYRYSLEAVLVLIFAAGTGCRDLVHGGYLLFSLLFLRRRNALILKTHKLWNRLRVYNFALLLIGVLFQAPLLGFLPLQSNHCTLLDIVGVHQSPNKSQSSAWGDLVVFFLAYFQACIFDTQEYQEVIVFERDARNSDFEAKRAKDAAWTTKQLAECLMEVQRKANRHNRIREVQHKVSSLAAEVMRLERGVPAPDALQRVPAHTAVPSDPTDEATRSPSSTALVALGERGSPIAQVERTNSAATTADMPGQDNEVRPSPLPGSSSSSFPPQQPTPVDTIPPRDSGTLGDEEDLQWQAMAAAVLRGHEAVKTAEELMRFVDETSGSVWDWMRPWLTRLWPWLSAPDGSMCFALYTLAYAASFNVMLLPPVLATYGFAQFAAPKPRVGFWRGMLLYTEACLLLLYLLAVPCYWGCWPSSRAPCSNRMWLPALRGGELFSLDVLPVFLAYFSTLMYVLQLSHRDDGTANLATTSRHDGATSSDALRMGLRDSLGLWLEEYAVDAEAATRHFLAHLFLTCENMPYFVKLVVATESARVDWHAAERAMNVMLLEARAAAPRARAPTHPTTVWRTSLVLASVLPEGHLPTSTSRICQDGSDAAVEGQGQVCRHVVVFEVVNADPSQPKWMCGLNPARRVARELLAVHRAQAQRGRNHRAHPQSLAAASPPPTASAHLIDHEIHPLVESVVVTDRVTASRHAQTEAPGVVLMEGEEGRSVGRDGCQADETLTLGEHVLRIESILPLCRKGVDFYGPTVLVDILVFLYLVVFYPTTVSSTVQDLAESVTQNQLPVGYVSMLFSVMLLVIIDRIIYLHACKPAKVIYHYFNLLGMCLWVQLVIWTDNPASHTSCSILCLLKSVSLALNARQIRCGYPERTRQHFLTQSTDLVSRGMFILYRSLPFLFEMRSLLDFACARSTLDLREWFKLEDINASLYIVAARNAWKAGKPVGQPQAGAFKAATVSLFVALLAVIWAPALLFSSGNPSVTVNPVYRAAVNLTMLDASGSSFPLFTGGMQRQIRFVDWDDVSQSESQADLGANQVQEVCVAPDSDVPWMPTPPSERAFLASALADASLLVQWTWWRTRPDDNTVMVAQAPPFALNSMDASRLREVVLGAAPYVWLEGLYPRFWELQGEGVPTPNFSSKELVSCRLALESETVNTSLTSYNARWWSLHCPVAAADTADSQSENNTKAAFMCLEHGQGPEAILVSAKVAAGLFARLSSLFGGVYGVYVVFVLAVGAFVRSVSANLHHGIPFEDLPSTARLQALCNDIYAMRMAGELQLEEELYHTLIRIYRTPAVLFEFTKL